MKFLIMLVSIAAVGLLFYGFLFYKSDQVFSVPHHDLISVSTPTFGAEVSSPLVVKGEARGFWFFEASFPVYLVDLEGKVLATGIAQAESDWMTEEFVPFSATLNFKNSVAQEGAIVLRKDNPSGLPENDDSFSWPVVISKTL